MLPKTWVRVYILGILVAGFCYVLASKASGIGFSHFINENGRTIVPLLEELKTNPWGLLEDKATCFFVGSRGIIDFEESIDYLHCHETEGLVVLLGDSHGVNLSNSIFFWSGRHRFTFISLVSEGCRLPHCEAYGNQAFRPGLLRGFGGNIRFVYHQSGSYLFSDIQDGVSLDRFEDALLRFAEFGSIIWVGSFPELGRTFRSYKSLNEFNGLSKVELEKTAELDRLLRMRLTESAIEFLSFNEIFEIPISAVEDGCFLFKDSDHLSRCGEFLVGSSGDFAKLTHVE